MADHILDEFSKHGWESIFRDGIMIPATRRYDKYFVSNGFKCELLMTNEGYPQFFLDDEIGLEGLVGVYKLNEIGKIRLHPMVEYQELFTSLNNSKLLTAFTLI